MKTGEHIEEPRQTFIKVIFTNLKHFVFKKEHKTVERMFGEQDAEEYVRIKH